MKNFTLTTLILAFAAISAFPQSIAQYKAPYWETINKFDYDDGNYSNRLVLNSAGECIVACQLTNSISIPPYTYNSSGIGDIFLSKMDTVGNLHYITRFLCSNKAEPMMLDCDQYNNIYIAGKFTGYIYIDTIVLNANTYGGENIFIAKLDPSGNAIWAKHLVGDITINDFERTPVGYHYFVGTSIGNIQLDGSNPFGQFNSAQEKVLFLILDNNGNYGMNSDFANGEITSIKLSSLNYPVVTIQNSSSLSVFWLNAAGMILKSSYFSASSDGSAEITNIEFDSQGNYYLGINSKSNILYQGTTISNNGAQKKIFHLCKFNANDDLIWWNSSQNLSYSPYYSTSYAKINNISLANDSSLFCYGTYQWDVQIFNHVLYDCNGSNFIAKTDSTGELLWFKDFGNFNNVKIGKILSDESCNLYFSGRIYYSWATIFDYLDNAPASWNSDFFLAKLNKNAEEYEGDINSILSPYFSPCGLTENEIAEIEIFNRGSKPISNFNISCQYNSNPSVTEVFTDTILPYSYASFQFQTLLNLSVPDTNIIQFKIDIPGDNYDFNDVATKTIIQQPYHQVVDTFPLLEDLENHQNWYVTEDSEWFVDSVFGYPPNYLYSKYRTNSLAWQTYSDDDYPLENNMIYSPCLDFSNIINPVFEMKIMLRVLEENICTCYTGNSSMYVEYSKDFGETWQLLGDTNTGINWYDGVSKYFPEKFGWYNNYYEYIPVSIDLDSLAGEPNVKLRIFRDIDSYLNEGMSSVDDIKIYDKSPYDAGSLGLKNIAKLQCSLDTLFPTVEIHNFGTQIIDSVIVVVRINELVQHQEICSLSILPGESINYSFMQGIACSEFSIMNIKSWTILEGDEHHLLDTCVNKIYNQGYYSDFPFTDGFESDTILWYAHESQIPYYFAEDVNFSFPSPPFGDNCWVANAYINDMIVDTLYYESPCFDFSNLDAPVFEMKTMAYIDWDMFLWLEASIDNGASWQIIGDTSSGHNWYNIQNPLSFGNVDPEHETKFYDWKTSWTLASELAFQPNVKFRIAVYLDYGHEQEKGFAVDDIRIYNMHQFELGVIDILAENECIYDQPYPVAVALTNRGRDTIANFPVQISYDNSAWIQETVFDTIFPNDTIIYSLTNLPGFYENGEHLIEIQGLLPNDGIFENDTLSKTIINRLVSIDENSDYEYFESFDNSQWTTIDLGTGSSNWYITNSIAHSVTKNKSMLIRSNANQNILDYLVSPCILLDSGVVYELSYFLKNHLSPIDLEVCLGREIITDSFNVLVDTIMNFSSTDFKKYSNELSVNKTGIYYLCFKMDGYYSNFYLCLDDVNIKRKVNSIAANGLKISSPCNFPFNESVRVEIANNGLNPVSAFNISYKLDGNIPITEFCADTIQAGDTIIYTFSDSINILQAGLYSVSAWVDLPNDEFRSDDTCFGMLKLQNVISTIPYEQNFDSQPVWINKKASGEWKIENGIDYNSNYTDSADKVLAFSVEGNNSLSSGDWVETPCFNLYYLQSPYIRLQYYNNLTFSEIVCEASVDGGNSWVSDLGNYTDDWLDEGKDGNMAVGIAGLFNLSFYSSVKFRFRHITEGRINTAESFIIDKFEIREYLYGCTDIYATNYNSLALVDNGNCSYNCQADASFIIDDLGSNTYLFSLAAQPFMPLQSLVWYFGEGGNFYEDSVIYHYENPGSYQISCSINYPISQCDDIAHDTLLVTGCGLSSQFSVNQVSTGVYSFSFNYPYNAGNDISSWDFGDGTIVENFSICTHAYDTTGLFTVTASRLDASNSQCESSYSQIVDVNAVPHDFQIFNLSENWNIFSTFISPANPYLSSALVKWEDLNIMKDEDGAVFWPQYSINMIGDFTIGEGYQVNMFNNARYYLTGNSVLPEQNPITLELGWNILGYLRQSSAQIDQLLQTIIQSIEIVKDENGLVYWPVYQVNQIGNMIPGKGYQIKINQPVTLTYPAN